MYVHAGASSAWLSGAYFHNEVVIDVMLIAFSDMTVSPCAGDPANVFASFSFMPSHSVDDKVIDPSDETCFDTPLSFQKLAGGRIKSSQKHLLHREGSTRVIGAI